MKYFKYSVVAVIFLLKPLSSFSWGAEGHRLTAQVAYELLDNATKDSLKVYLGKMDIANAATWMDDMRSNPKYEYLTPYHYFDMDKGKKYNMDSTENIVGELIKVIHDLKERNKHTTAENELNIKILIHLMGDLHQPLHVGYPVDRGGNLVEVSFLSRSDNLHKVWDTDIIQQNSVTKKGCLKLLSKYSPEEIARLEKIDVVGWMYDSRSYLDQVYDFRNSTIDLGYTIRNVKIIERQIAVGGLRLAHVLKEIFEGK